MEEDNVSMVLRKAGEEAEDAASEGLLTAAAIVRINSGPLSACLPQIRLLTA